MSKKDCNPLNKINLANQARANENYFYTKIWLNRLIVISFIVLPAVAIFLDLIGVF